MLLKWQEDNLRIYRVQLVENITTECGLLAHMRAKGVMGPRQESQILLPIHDNFRKTELLLDFMNRRPPEDYEKFMQCLNETYHTDVVQRYLIKGARGDAPQQETLDPGCPQQAAPPPPPPPRAAPHEGPRVFVNAEPASLPPGACGVRMGPGVPVVIRDEYIHPMLPTDHAELTEAVERLHIVVDDNYNDDNNGGYEELPYDVAFSSGVQETDDESTGVKELEACMADGISIPIKIHNTLQEVFEKVTRESAIELYKMDKRRKGRCCIISVKKVEGRDERTGTEEDKTSLHELFLAIGYVVEAYSDTDGDDLTAQGITAIVRAFSGRLQEEDPSAVLCLLSHGDKGSIRGTDDGSVQISTLLAHLDNRNCENMRNKPKMIFTQACRGGETDTGLAMPDGDPSVSDATRESKRLSMQPNVTDFLIGYATRDDHRAWRNRSGSFYIRALVLVFMRHAHELCVSDMLVKVNDLVSKTTIRTVENGTVSQMPSFENQLRKKIFLFPGIGN